MTNQIMTFTNKEFGSVRTVDVNGEPWFVGRDVCAAFGDKNNSRSISRIDEEDKITIEITDSMGRTQKVIAINESGLYSLLFAMQPQKARKNGVSDVYPIETQKRIEKLHRFKRWVTSEVLPSIRKTGSYFITKKLDSYMIENPVERAKRWIEEYEEKLALEQKIENDKPLVDFANHVSNTSDLIDIGTLAKLAQDENIKIGRNKLFEWLRDNGYLMSSYGHKNEPYQKYLDENNKLFEVKEYTYNTPYGVEIGMKTYVTGKGQIYFIEKLRKEFAA